MHNSHCWWRKAVVTGNCFHVGHHRIPSAAYHWHESGIPCACWFGQVLFLLRWIKGSHHGAELRIAWSKPYLVLQIKLCLTSCGFSSCQLQHSSFELARSNWHTLKWLSSYCVLSGVSGCIELQCIYLAGTYPILSIFDFRATFAWQVAALHRFDRSWETPSAQFQLHGIEYATATMKMLEPFLGDLSWQRLPSNHSHCAAYYFPKSSVFMLSPLMYLCHPKNRGAMIPLLHCIHSLSCFSNHLHPDWAARFTSCIHHENCSFARRSTWSSIVPERAWIS